MSSPERMSRKRGRPALLSRAQIVAAAMELLRAEPARKLTMQRLAKALDAAPMALYTHVRNREDLMQAIAEDVLGQVKISVDHARWQSTVAAWARALRTQFLRYPFVASLLQDGIATPAAWLEVSNPLLQALSAAGLRDEALADAQRWVSRVVTGSVLMELILPSVVPQELVGVRRALENLPAPNRAVWMGILPALGQRSDEEVFEFTLARTLDALEAYARTAK